MSHQVGSAPPDALESLVTKTGPAKGTGGSHDVVRDVDIKYPTGDQAVLLDDIGCGFCYYESGRVAVCVSKVNALQKRYYFYANNRSKVLLCSIDEHVVGMAGRPDGTKLVLTKDSAILSNATNDIVKTWRWNPNAQNAGTPPSDPIVIQLNESLTFKFVDRKHIAVKFVSVGVSVVFECGERLKRDDTYLQHSTKIQHGAQRGKLLVDTAHQPNLIQRQKQIEVAALEKRSKQHPRSTDLTHSDIKQVVTALEHKFDDYQGLHVTPYCTGSWLQDAQSQTLADLPVLPKTGFEVGKAPTLFGREMHPHAPSHLVSTLQDKDGKWLSSLDIRTRLERASPVLPRTAVLCNASGRYSVDIQIPGGSAQPEGTKLEVVSGHQLDDFLKDDCATDQLVVVACLREDDLSSRKAEKVLQLVATILAHPQEDLSPHALPQAIVAGIVNAKYRLVKVDLAESREFAKRFSIHATPTFLMFFEGKLVGVTSLGGHAVRIAPTTRNVNLTSKMDHPPRTLLVQRGAKQQVLSEKTLRKELFAWDLALGAEEAFQRLSKLNKATQGHGVPPCYNLLLLCDDIGEADLRSLERYIRSTDSKKAPNPTQQCVVGLIVTSPVFEAPFASTLCQNCRTAQGRRVSVATIDDGVCPHCGIIPKAIVEASSAMSTVLSVAQVFIYRHIRAPTLHRLAEKWADQVTQKKSEQMLRGAEVELHKGLTKDTLLREMERYLQAGRRGLFVPKDSTLHMALSAADTSVLNTHLTGKPNSA
ncbi:hypothetical protein, variant 1 [Aphanomyces invadans]|uniref:FAM194 C-terminal domain-containing protein n=1 Tax=Aphanomyces invadans TaxID=157072 RepID=A0A024UBE4_9STRA|nr:hypothetical protein, variant 1 [Aphanomyces invadans]ETW03736.1 hypothetical protein, variant 1 [Aphanomyces invadans]|eukprot:XP_008867965.1 hypothetical protein, variant 1 [Aphanomyces invadans]